MATDISNLVRAAWRKYVSDGIASSGKNNPDKTTDIFAFGDYLQSAIDLIRTAISNLQSIVTTGTQRKPAVVFRSTSTGALATAFVNGTTHDGHVAVTGERFIMDGRTDAKENGFYTVPDSGAPVRSTDADSGAELWGATAYVSLGTIAKGRTYTVSNKTAPVLGVDDIIFAQTGQETSLAAVTSSAGAADSGKISALDALGKLSLTFLNYVLTSAGAGDASKLIITDGSGKMSYTMLPAMIQYLQDEGLLFAAGDGSRALLGVSDDGAGTLLGPWAGMMSDLAHVPDVRPRLYLAGHSWCDQCSSDYATEARGWLWWLQFLSGASFDFQLNQNYGLGGSDTIDLVRQSLELSTQPSGITINMSGTNDLIFTADHSIMNYEAAEALQTKVGGHRAIWVTDAPRGDGNGKSQSAGLTGDTLENQFRRAQWQREAGGRKGVYSVDIVPTLINLSSATAKGLDTVFYDGLHLGPPGAWRVAKVLLPTIDFLVPRRSRLPITNADTYTANNVSGSLFDNPMMAGTAGTAGTNCSGSVANLITAVAGAGLTAVLSKVTDAEGIVWQQVAISGTPSGAHTDGPPLDVDAVSCVLTADLDKDDFTAGDIVEAVCAAEIDTGHSGVRGIPIYLVATAGGVDYVVCGGEPNMAAEGASVKAANLAFPDPGTKLAGVNITPQLTIPASLSAIKLKMLVTAKGGTAISATVRFSRAAPRKVVYNG